MKGFTPPTDSGKRATSTGPTSYDGAALPPCKDSAAPTAAKGGFPYKHRTVAQNDYIETSFANRTRSYR